jgi:hypothetical protein
MKSIRKLINKLFYPKGTWFGSRCSGWGVYPDGRKCGGCDDCEDHMWNKQIIPFKGITKRRIELPNKKGNVDFEIKDDMLLITVYSIKGIRIQGTQAYIGTFSTETKSHERKDN